MSISSNGQPIHSQFPCYCSALRWPYGQESETFDMRAMNNDNVGCCLQAVIITCIYGWFRSRLELYYLNHIHNIHVTLGSCSGPQIINCPWRLLSLPCLVLQQVSVVTADLSFALDGDSVEQFSRAFPSVMVFRTQAASSSGVPVSDIYVLHVWHNSTISTVEVKVFFLFPDDTATSTEDAQSFFTKLQTNDSATLIFSGLQNQPSLVSVVVAPRISHFHNMIIDEDMRLCWALASHPS